jgi:hypothetical protein
MQFQKYDLGYLDSGNVVEVTLGTAANVKLMDSSNFQKYRAGREYQCYGGYVTRSPYKVSVPRTDNWHVVIDLGGNSGTIRSAVRVIG